jgi:hypothetical protein
MAGIDVNKKRLAVVVADVEVEDEYQFERRWYLPLRPQICQPSTPHLR